jgi:hypothetical protein
MHFYFLLAQHLKEGGQQGHELFPVYGLIAIHVQQVKEVFHVISRGLLPADEVYEGLDYAWELALGEAVVLVVVEFVEEFLQEGRDVFLAEVTRDGHDVYFLILYSIGERLIGHKG